MTGFAGAVRQSERRGMSLRVTAAAAHYDPGMLAMTSEKAPSRSRQNEHARSSPEAP
jgi:hypothetical protein